MVFVDVRHWPFSVKLPKMAHQFHFGQTKCVTEIGNIFLALEPKLRKHDILSHAHPVAERTQQKLW